MRLGPKPKAASPPKQHNEEPPVPLPVVAACSTSTGTITLFTLRKCSLSMCCYAFLTFHLIFAAAIGSGQQAATFVTDKQRHWTTSATFSTDIDRQVLVVASAKTQPKDQRVDLLHFVSANDSDSDRSRRNPMHSAAISIPVLEDRRFEASADFRAENGRFGFSLGLKRESSERGIFRNIARVSFHRY